MANIFLDKKYKLFFNHRQLAEMTKIYSTLWDTIYQLEL